MGKCDSAIVQLTAGFAREWSKSYPANFPTIGLIVIGASLLSLSLCLVTAQWVSFIFLREPHKRKINQSKIWDADNYL